MPFLVHRLLAPLLIGLCGLAAAAEPDACRNVRLATPGWADIDATNALLGVTLKAIGYRPRVSMLSVPLVFQGLRSGKVDAFLGNWMPAQRQLAGPLLASGQVERIATNLEGARFTLAVPRYAAQAGVRSFADLGAHADAFGRRIYGIEAGAPANESIRRLIADPAAGLAGWQLVESSDTALLAQLGRDLPKQRMVVFLAWEPHVVNTRFDIVYLRGGDTYFGPGGGTATVSTVSWPGYAAQCGNVARLLAQLKFSVALENEMLRLILDRRLPPELAAQQILRGQPQWLGTWLAGVKTADGAGDALAAARQALR
ncbi:glycine betaine ABC transporter substrate-binding protein [Xylophilus sp.]|uniref:glycine betaine ABC transporter substrate-binding protein n=1 Tax=Xylophilus sp. TaxID=2653893 RepID=UPI0013B71661|nr:glycine betaine ABC transporter substrate-binding protein [Xylophilus sp.]KAF1046752.1 MAG: Glycine betaine-binding protein OpuAC [Xylophilus sp.]